MEFLMTYGWAILVVLAAIAALAYFGVLSPDRFVPDKCLVQGGGITCTEYKADATANTVTIILSNDGGSTLSDVNVTLAPRSGCTLVAPADFVNLGPIADGGTASAVFTCGGTIGSKVRGDITIDYLPEGKTLVQTATGSLSAKSQ